MPVGVGSGFYGGTPFLSLYRGYQGKISYDWQGEHLSGERLKFREPGGRFWEDWTYSSDLMTWDGKQLELNIVTYEYPEIFVGRADETAIIDLTGMSKMAELVTACGADA